MKYRAKVTQIPSHTTDIHYLYNRQFVTDKTDIYIEVESEEEAELIEEINELSKELTRKRLQLYNFRKQHQ